MKKKQQKKPICFCLLYQRSDFLQAIKRLVLSLKFANVARMRRMLRKKKKKNESSVKNTETMATSNEERKQLALKLPREILLNKTLKKKSLPVCCQTSSVLPVLSVLTCCYCIYSTSMFIYKAFRLKIIDIRAHNIP